MPRKAVLPKDFNSYDFVTLSKNEPNPRARQRLLAMAHLQDGETITNTAKIFKVFRRTIHNWINSFINNGIAGLYDEPRSGRNCKLSNDTLNNLSDEITELQKNRDGGRINGYDIKDYINDKYHTNFSISGIYKILHRIGMSWISSRSKHPNVDVKAQADFKNNFKKK